jgi:hypothetical protein
MFVMQARMAVPIVPRVPRMGNRFGRLLPVVVMMRHLVLPEELK